jgi:hypothetical protein
MDRRQVVVAFDTLSGAARPDRTAGDAIVPLFDDLGTVAEGGAWLTPPLPSGVAMARAGGGATRWKGAQGLAKALLIDVRTSSSRS